jgi:polyisoprenyl-teichoic acid--peptidoglycan teichoic acid transferase
MLMKKLLKVLIGIVLTVSILVLAFVGWAQWKWDPKRHFEQVNHPVLMKQTISNTTTNVQLEDKPEGDEEKEEEEENSFNVLILGIDGSMKADTRTDVMMVVHVNLKQSEVNILSIPRDTRVLLPDIGYTKINHAHFLENMKAGSQSGTDAAVSAVTELLDIPISYYIKVDFWGFKRIIDQIGGIEINLSEEVGGFPKGLNSLDGGEALKLVRERKTLPNGDLDRQDNQVLVLKAIVKKILQPSQILKLPNLIKDAKAEMIETNFTNEDLLSLSLLLKDLDSLQLNNLKVPGTNGKKLDPLIKKELYYWLPDEKELTEMVNEYF